MTKTLLALAVAVGLVAAAPASAVAPGANGKLLYTLQTTGNFDIWKIESDGSGNAPLVTDAANDQGGSWSPDGTKIVFWSTRTGAGDIYIANADGTNQLRLTTDPNQEAHPSFSPDGTRIVFVRRDPDDEIVRVKPRRDRKLPFRYVISGLLRLPTAVSAAEACGGSVTLQVKRGRRKLATSRARLSRSCRYRKVISFRSTRGLRASKGRLKVTTAFLGNALLTTKRGAPKFVRFG